MNYKKHLAKLLQDPEFKAEYEALEAEYRRRRGAVILRHRLKAIHRCVISASGGDKT
mgnify:FL=1